MFYFKEPSKIRAAIAKLTTFKQLWLDTEVADWYTTNPRLSLIQISVDPTDRVGDRVGILDVLDRPDSIAEFIDRIMKNPNIEKIFHNAAYDLKYLGGATAQNITCTYKLAQKISKERLGTSNLKLKTLAVELCHFSNVDAEPQSSNWGRRPLSNRQLHYAKMDTVYLAGVYQHLGKLSANPNSVSFSVTKVRIAFECPRLFYLNHNFGSKPLFLAPNKIEGIGTIFHKQAEELINLVKTEPQFKTLFQLPAAELKIDRISSQIQQLFYQLKFFPYLQTTIAREPSLAPALNQVWLGITNLIEKWTKLLIGNRSHYNAESLIERTFIEQEIKFEHNFILPDGSQQKLIGKFDSLIYDATKHRHCIVEYKTYEPVDPSAQLAQVALYSYILWAKEQQINDSAVYCVLPEFKAFNYTWEQLKDRVHQLIPHKLQQMRQWISWQPETSDAPPPPTTSTHLCEICPQQQKCQTFFKLAEIELAIPTLQPSTEADLLGNQLVEILQSFNINVSYTGAAVGAAFIRVKLKPNLGVKFVSIANRTEDLKIHLGIDTPPLITPQAGYASIDVPRQDRQIANFYDYIQQRNNPVDTAVKIAIGINLEGTLIEADLSDPNTCHFLVGGTTGSGKSEFLRSILLSLLYRHSSQQLKIALVDPKRVTFPEFESMPWLLSPIVKDSEAAITLMENLVSEMERRYRLFEVNKCPHLDVYNRRQPVPEPRIVCIFDEYADFMAEKETRNAIEQSIKRLGAMARAAGIHLIVATQRPEAKVITPIIRSNLPGRIALRTSSEADSSIVFGGKQPEAAYLLGKGDLLYRVSVQLQRLQSLFADSIRLPE